MRDRFGIFGAVIRIRMIKSTLGNDVKNAQQAFFASLPGKVDY